MPNPSSDVATMPGAWRRWFPLAFLVAISASWMLLYRVDGFWTAGAQPLPDWLFMIDALLVLPLVCLLCERDLKRGGTKALSYAALAVLIGSLLIPDASKQTWHLLEQGRYLLLIVLLAMEFSAVMTVVLAVRSALAAGVDPDRAVLRPLTRWLGDGTVARLMAFEARVWTYALFPGRIQPEMFQGAQHFTYHDKDGAQSNAFGFLMLIALEAPLVHLVLHFTVSAWLANVVTLLTGFGFLYMLAEARSMSRRPVSIASNALHVRYGLFAPMTIPLDRIAFVESHLGRVRRGPEIKRFNFSGDPNLCVQLSPPVAGIRKLYLGLDNPERFKRAMQACRAN